MALPLKPKRLVQNGLVAHYAPIRQRNLLKWSENFSKSEWNKSNTTVNVLPMVVPDGNFINVSEVIPTVLNGSVNQSFSCDPINKTFTLSIWLKSNVNHTATIKIQNTDATQAVEAYINVTTTWQRFTIKKTFTSSSTLVRFLLWPGAYGGSTNSVYAWGAQLELSPSATTYQRTTDLQTVWNQKQENMSVTNLVANGNFANGTSGWSASTASTNTASNNILSNIGDGTNASVRTNGTTNIACAIGKKIYIKAKLTVKNSVTAGIILYVGTTGVGGKEVTRQLTPIQDIQYKLSGIVTLDSNDVGNIQPRCYHYYADAATANGKVMEVQQVFSVDLTSLFGAGNEPQTVQQCDEMFSNWFDGSIRMNLNRYNGMLGSTSAVDVNDPTYDGTGLSFGGDDYVNIGNIGKEMRTCQIVFYTPIVINKDSVGQTLINFINGEGTLTLGSGTSALTNEVIHVQCGSGLRCGWCSTIDSISIGWHVVEIIWDGTKYRILLDGAEKPITIAGTPVVLTVNALQLGRQFNGSSYFTGKQAEIFISDRSLTDAELAQNRAYFRQECARLGVILP